MHKKEEEEKPVHTLIGEAVEFVVAVVVVHVKVYILYLAYVSYDVSFPSSFFSNVSLPATDVCHNSLFLRFRLFL